MLLRELEPRDASPADSPKRPSYVERAKRPPFGRPKPPPPPLSPERAAGVAAHAKAALLLEGRLKRPVTRNDLFVQLHVPYDLLDLVTRALAGAAAPLDLERLGSLERANLERDSHALIVWAMAGGVKDVERRGLTVADVATWAPPAWTLEDVARLFGYVRAVLELKELPNAAALPSYAAAALARARSLPEGERTLFRLVVNLGVGLYTARLVRATLEVGR